MPKKWNEEEALKRFSHFEWDHIAKLAFDQGYDAEGALEETLSEEEDVPVDRSAVLPLARQALAASALLAPFANDPNIVAVWLGNFYNGWRAGESGASTHIYVESPGNPREEY